MYKKMFKVAAVLSCGFASTGFAVNHDETFKRAHAERNILKVLEGDCETAVGAYADIKGDKITLTAELFSLDGSKRYYEKRTKYLQEFKELGYEVGQNLKLISKVSYKK